LTQCRGPKPKDGARSEAEAIRGACTVSTLMGPQLFPASRRGGFIQFWCGVCNCLCCRLEVGITAEASQASSEIMHPAGMELANDQSQNNRSACDPLEVARRTGAKLLAARRLTAAGGSRPDPPCLAPAAAWGWRAADWRLGGRSSPRIQENWPRRRAFAERIVSSRQLVAYLAEL